MKKIIVILLSFMSSANLLCMEKKSPLAKASPQFSPFINSPFINSPLSPGRRQSMQESPTMAAKLAALKDASNRLQREVPTGSSSPTPPNSPRKGDEPHRPVFTIKKNSPVASAPVLARRASDVIIKLSATSPKSSPSNDPTKSFLPVRSQSSSEEKVASKKVHKKK